MGEMIDIVGELRRDNPHAKAVDLQVYADALRTYHEAAVNVRKNGAIVAHPRTGSPIENPYLKVQTATGSQLIKLRNVKADRVMNMLIAEDIA